MKACLARRPAAQEHFGCQVSCQTTLNSTSRSAVQTLWKWRAGLLLPSLAETVPCQWSRCRTALLAHAKLGGMATPEAEVVGETFFQVGWLGDTQAVKALRSAPVAPKGTWVIALHDRHPRKLIAPTPQEKRGQLSAARPKSRL